MWLENLKEMKKERNMSTKAIAEKSGLPEKTVARVFSGKTANPYIDTLSQIARALECTLSDILADTKVVLGDKNMAQMQEEVDTLVAERDSLVAEKEVIVTQNCILEDKVKALSAEIDLLKMQLAHKEELLAIHNYYITQLKK